MRATTSVATVRSGPLVAVAKALDGIPLRTYDVICVLEGVLPNNTNFIPSLVAGVSATDADVLILAPPVAAPSSPPPASFIIRGELAGSGGASRCRLVAGLLLHGGDPTRGPRELRSQETGTTLVQPFHQS